MDPIIQKNLLEEQISNSILNNPLNQANNPLDPTNSIMDADNTGNDEQQGSDEIPATPVVESSSSPSTCTSLRNLRNVNKM